MSQVRSTRAEVLAFGKWPEILTKRGMDPAFFSGKHGPCPFCGGRDRYRWSKKYGGVWHCNADCTGGKFATGFSMLMRHMGYANFREAADDVREFFGENPTVVPLSREQRIALSGEMTPELVSRNRTRMMKFWTQAREVTEGDPVWKYMQNRVPGMDFIPANIRFHPSLEYWKRGETDQDKPVFVGSFPAMLAYAQGSSGELVQLHKTFLTSDGFTADVPMSKKTDYGVGVNSFAVRMTGMFGDALGVCEGLETGWASAMIRRIPIWPCLNGPALSEFEVPDDIRSQVRTVYIFSDHDELKPFGRNPDGSQIFKRPGRVYAEKLARRLQSQGFRTMIIRAAKVGNDMADYWKARVAA